MPFEEAPMGTTGLETAFAALYTELVLPGVLPLALVVEKLSAGAALVGLPLPAIAVGRPADLCLIDLAADVGGRRGGLRVARGELLLRRPHAAGPRARHAGRRGGRLPGAGVRPERRMTAYVLLEDGTRFDGEACAAPGPAVGEVVFTTGMSGYQECVTDPSFHAQLLTFTAPMVGNYGASAAAMESTGGARPRGDHARGGQRQGRARGRGRLARLAARLRRAGHHGVDTRALVRHIRDAGAMLGGIFPGATSEERGARADRRRAADDRPRPRARGHAGGAPSVHAGDGTGPRIVALDTGIKTSIIRNFTERGATLELLPCTTPADEVLARGADGIFLVPGPGDPAAMGPLVRDGARG